MYSDVTRDLGNFNGMMSQTQFTELKKSICTRLLDEMPEAALGELIAAMREIKEHYATVSPKQQNVEAAQQTTSYKAKTLPTRPNLGQAKDANAAKPPSEAVDLEDTDPTPLNELKEAMKIQQERKAVAEKVSKPTSMARPENFAEQLVKRRKEKEQAIAEARRIAKARKNITNSA
jgi:hypothetical protein